MTDEDYEKRADELIKELGPAVDRERLLRWIKANMLGKLTHKEAKDEPQR